MIDDFSDDKYKASSIKHDIDYKAKKIVIDINVREKIAERVYREVVAKTTSKELIGTSSSSPVIKDVIQKTLSTEPKYQEPPNKTSHPHLNIVASGVGEDRVFTPGLFKRVTELQNFSEIFSTRYIFKRAFLDNLLSNDSLILHSIKNVTVFSEIAETFAKAAKKELSNQVAASERISMLFTAIRFYFDQVSSGDTLEFLFRKPFTDEVSSEQAIKLNLNKSLSIESISSSHTLYTSFTKNLVDSVLYSEKRQISIGKEQKDLLVLDDRSSIKFSKNSSDELNTSDSCSTDLGKVFYDNIENTFTYYDNLYATFLYQEYFSENYCDPSYIEFFTTELELVRG
jgi:hypothetical protein